MSTATPSPSADETAPRENVLQTISTAMVRIYKDQFGRGPTRVRTSYAGPDTIVCVLEDSQTPAERKLVELGEFQRLRDVRMFFQYALSDELKHPVEQATGRRVRALVSGTAAQEDVSVELFVLDDGPPIPGERDGTGSLDAPRRVPGSADGPA